MAPPLLAIPIITAVGRFAAPYLSKELSKLGLNKFVSTYGKDAFTSLNETLAADTPMLKADSVPMVNENYKAGATAFTGDLTVPGVIAPDATEIDKESKKIREMTKPVGFPADPPIKPDIKTGDSTPPKLDTVEAFPKEEKLPDTLSTPMPDPEGPQIYYNRDAELQEGLAEYEEIYSEERFAKANKEYPKYDPANTKKIVEADKHFGAVSLGRQYGNDMDNVQLIYISPDEYLNLATEMNPDSDWSNAKIEYLENKIRQGKEIGEIPILFVGRTGEDYNVRGHEGRHRAQAFKNAGYDKIPVRIEGFGKDKENDVENKLYTATKRSYLYKEPWAQEYIGFIPKRIVTERLRDGSVLSGEEAFSINLNPGDFYDVLTKNKLFEKENVNEQTENLVRGIGDNNPPSAIEEETTISKTTPKEYKGEIIETTSLNENLKEAIAKYAGTPEDIAKSLKMPQSHKRKIYIQLEEYLNENYPSKLSEKEQEVESDALFYIANSVYDIYTYRGEGGMPRDTLMVQDDIGFPLATAEIERYPKGKLNYYPRRKKGNKYVKTDPAIYIETIGSLNRDATSKILDQVEKIADSEDVRYIVAEDLTSEAAAKALEKRGFVPAKKGFFEGDIINEADWRGGKKNVKQKNMVLDLGEKYRTTEEEIQKEFDKEQSDINNQTKKLLKK
jgi:hypothetical protein